VTQISQQIFIFWEFQKEKERENALKTIHTIIVEFSKSSKRQGYPYTRKSKSPNYSMKK
jgi:hypothetical protein